MTAGTAVRESIALLSAASDVHVTALYVSVDRMERGTGDKATLDELRDSLGIRVYPIINVQDIITSLPAGDEKVEKMERYLGEYGAR